MNLLQQFKRIRTFIFDIDGVLTDGRVLVLRDGLQARQMHVKDGFGLQMALRNGYKVLIVSGGYSEESRSRLEKLGIKEIHLAIADKTKFVEEYVKKQKLDWQAILYMGDDLPDIPLMQKVGLSSCPADAAVEVRAIVHYISPINGGWGCVRDVIEKVLKANEHWRYDEQVSSV